MEREGPIARYKEQLIAKGFFTEEEAEALRKEAKQEIEDSVEFAKNSPEPGLETLMEDIYA